MTESRRASLIWSAQFAVPTRHSHALAGDKILLPPSTLDALLSASSSAAAETARREFPAYDPYNSATYSAYRRAESEYQDHRQQLPYPLTFKLINSENGKFVYAGIREFSAQEGEVVLSPFLREALGLGEQDESEELMEVGFDADSDRRESRKKTGPMITIHARELSKGTFVRLRPLEAGYDVDDWKSLLEQHLRQDYTTLTNREMLVVQGVRGKNGKRVDFRFLVDGFKPDADGICIVDTDLEVDIEALNEDQARETLERIAAKFSRTPDTEQGSSRGGEIDLFKPQIGQVQPGEYVDYKLSSWNRTQPLDIELAGEDEVEDLTLLVSSFGTTQRAKPRVEEYMFADLDSRPTKRLRLEPSNVAVEDAEALYVSVHCFADPSPFTNGAGHIAVEPVELRRYTLRARHPDPDHATNGTVTQDLEAPPSSDDIRCKNCLLWVPKRTLFLHENFCFRNNIACPNGCRQVFQKRSTALETHWHCSHDTFFGNTDASRQNHNLLYHPLEPLHCSECKSSETFSSVPLLAHHRTTTCPGKLILCRFCHLEVPQGGDSDTPNAEALVSGLTPHELADGARTTECHLCNKIVRLRDMDTHLKTHDLDRLARPPPIPCRNIYCGRTLDVCARNGDTRAGTRMGQGSGNDIGLCSVCFGPLYVSMYDPENKALQRRIERRYLQQLLTGCEKSWCRNELCKSGRKTLGIEGSVTTKAAVPMIKPYLDNLHQASDRLPPHFCVDEGSQRRKTLAAMLAAEDGSKDTNQAGYSFAWCLGALEAENGDIDGATRWLKYWAPTTMEMSQ